jgi:hypothetical protein
MTTKMAAIRTPDISMVTGFSDSEISKYDLEIFQLLLLAINKVLPPAIIVVGLVGNVLAFVVLRQPQYAKQTTCFFMRTLAIFDTSVPQSRGSQDDREL